MSKTTYPEAIIAVAAIAGFVYMVTSPNQTKNDNEHDKIAACSSLAAEAQRKNLKEPSCVTTVLSGGSSVSLSISSTPAASAPETSPVSPK